MLRAYALLPTLLLAIGPARAQAPPAPLATLSFPAGTLGTVLGSRIVDTRGGDIGLIVDLLVDRDGKPRAAVIDFGGFLGVGTRRVAVAWETLRFSHTPGETRIVEDLTAAEVATAPEFHDTSGPVVILAPDPARP